MIIMRNCGVPRSGVCCRSSDAVCHAAAGEVQMSHLNSPPTFLQRAPSVKSLERGNFLQ